MTQTNSWTWLRQARLSYAPPLFLAKVGFMMFVIHPACFAQPASSVPAPDLLPSEALLEFLLEFESADDEAFDLVLQRGVNDLESKDAKPKDLEPKGSKSKDIERKNLESKKPEPKDLEPKDQKPKDLESKPNDDYEAADIETEKHD